MEIIKYPNEILRTKCEPVQMPLSLKDKKTFEELYALCKSIPEAVGLSAPQVGISKQMFVVCIRNKEGKVIYNLIMANPKITKLSSKKYSVDDGEKCLSEPGVTVFVPRCEKILVTGYDVIRCKKISYVCQGFVAAVIQHECDHLEGKLLIDYLGGKNG